MTLWIHVMTTEVCSVRFPHSDISGSMDICSSPKLFAAYHVFHRLLVPRHPPCALISLTSWRLLSLLVSVHSVALTGLWFSSSFDIPFGISLGCLDIFFFLRFYLLLNMRFSRYMLDWSLSVIRKLNLLSSLITGKNQLYRTALPCWHRLTYLSHRLCSLTSFAFISTC